MSSRKGDKSRHHRIRKQNIARRLKTRLLREALSAKVKAPVPTAPAVS